MNAKLNNDAIKTITRQFNYVQERASWHASQMRLDADDLAQEAFKRALSHIQRKGLDNRLEDSDRSARAFLRTVVRTTAIDIYRKNEKSELLSGLDDAGSTPEATFRSENYHADANSAETNAAENAQASRLWTAVQSLSPLQQDIVRLVYIKGLTSREAGVSVGKSAGAVRMQLQSIHELLFWNIKDGRAGNGSLSPRQRRAAAQLAAAFETRVDIRKVA